MMGSGDNALITKKIIHPGTKSINYVDGTKVYFHFKTVMCNDKKTVLDDSKTTGKPMELVIGKKFKLEVWEAIVQKMALNEVAQFTVNKNLVLHYPFISKTLRDARKPEEARRTHCCAMVLQTEGMGYRDLEDYMKDPTDLEFTIEILQVDNPGEYEKDTWQMDENEKLRLVSELKTKGNELFHQKNFESAATKYAEAIGYLEQLMLKEKPHESEWNELNKLKIPLLLNFSQCKLNVEDYYAAIEHCTTVLKNEPENVKALYRRAKGHMGAWNPDAARKDFEKVMALDPSLTSDIKKHLTNIEIEICKRNADDKEKFKNLF